MGIITYLCTQIATKVKQKERRNMKYGIIGTGAIGGYYGARLAWSGQEVHFLLRSDYEYVREHGLQVDSCNGSFHLEHPHVYQSTADMPKLEMLEAELRFLENR